MSRVLSRQTTGSSRQRTGFVLLLVLVVVTLLSFDVYSFSSLMVTEFGAAKTSLQHLKRRQLAESALELAIADLCSPPKVARKTTVTIPLADGESGMMTLLQRLPSRDGVKSEIGWLNESSKLNLRTLPLKSSRRPLARRRLTMIPGMTAVKIRLP